MSYSLFLLCGPQHDFTASSVAGIGKVTKEFAGLAQDSQYST